MRWSPCGGGLAGRRDLVARVVADVDDRLEEDGAAEREDRDAAALDPVLKPVRALADVRPRLTARDDLVLVGGAEDPARVWDQLVVRQRQQRTAAQLALDRRGVQRD